MRTKPSGGEGSAQNWWMLTHEGWEEVRDAALKRWKRLDRAEEKLDEAVALTAMVFGYGARGFYGQHRAWTDVRAQLEADWKTARRDRRHPWNEVARAVKTGWTAALTPVDPDHDPSSLVDMSTPAGDAAEPQRAVRGGRPDHPLRDHAAEEEPRPAEERVPGGRMDLDSA